ncbi:MAG: (d)CMP kinase [Rhodobacterales bacterium]
MSFVVAIDGPAAAGKGTIGLKLAKIFDFSYLDTGLLYRAVASKALETGVFPEIVAQNLHEKDLLKSNLRDLNVAKEASIIAAVPKVRLALMDFQKYFSEKTEGAVLDGRDIGTVICPKADVKFFISADPNVRAERRFNELQARGIKTNLKTVYEGILVRDRMDSNRELSPMRKADDAFLIDTSNLSIIEAINIAKKLVDKVITEKSSI